MLLCAEKTKNTSSKSQGKLDEPHQEAQEDSEAAEVVPQQWRVATKIPRRFLDRVSKSFKKA